MAEKDGKLVFGVKFPSVLPKYIDIIRNIPIHMIFIRFDSKFSDGCFYLGQEIDLFHIMLL